MLSSDCYAGRIPDGSTKDADCISPLVACVYALGRKFTARRSQDANPNRTNLFVVQAVALHGDALFPVALLSDRGAIVEMC